MRLPSKSWLHAMLILALLVAVGLFAREHAGQNPIELLTEFIDRIGATMAAIAHS